MTYKYSNQPNSDGTRTYTIYKDGEWNASYTSIDGESYTDFLNRIDSDVYKQSEGKLNSKW